MERSTAAIACGCLFLSGALLAGCGKPAAAAQGGKPAAPAENPPPAALPREEGVRVRLAAPRPSRFRGQVVATGDLRPQESALLGFSVGGRLDQISVRRGDAVQRGQVLGALDSSLARAGLSQAKSGVSAAYAQWKLALDGLSRTEAIRKHDGVAEAQVLQARTQRDLAEAQFAVARAQEQQAAAHLGHHTLRAPFSGVVTQVPSGTGIAVGPGTPLFGLEQTDTLILDTSVTPAQAAGLVPGSKVRVFVPATGASAIGKLRAVVPAADPASHRMPVEIALANPGQGFAPHMLARAELQTGERPALELPSTCLVQREGALSVYALVDGRQARRIPVQLLSQEAETSLVEQDDLLARARVVDMPPPDLSDGARVLSGGAP